MFLSRLVKIIIFCFIHLVFCFYKNKWANRWILYCTILLHTGTVTVLCATYISLCFIHSICFTYLMNMNAECQGPQKLLSNSNWKSCTETMMSVKFTCMIVMRIIQYEMSTVVTANFMSQQHQTGLLNLAAAQNTCDNFYHL